MNDYEIGRDIQELRCRIDRLELSSPSAPPSAIFQKHGQSMHLHTHAGVAPHIEPIMWKAENRNAVPAFLKAKLGFPQHIQFDEASSVSWTCHPDPLIFYVTWADGVTDEFFRFQNQLFTIFRVSDPNTGVVSCSASFDATLVASGKAQNYSSGGSLYFEVTLRNSSGGALQSVYMQKYPSGYRVGCGDNYSFSWIASFDPGLYDLVAGATWSQAGITGIQPC